MKRRPMNFTLAVSLCVIPLVTGIGIAAWAIYEEAEEQRAIEEWNAERTSDLSKCAENTSCDLYRREAHWKYTETPPAYWSLAEPMLLACMSVAFGIGLFISPTPMRYAILGE